MSVTDMDLGLYLNGGTLCAAVLGLFGIFMKLRSVEREITKDFDARIEKLTGQITQVGKEFEGRIDDLTTESLNRAESLRHETGEMGNTLRQKIHDVEIWIRDNFVSNRAFESVVQRVEETIEKNIGKLEKKIDEIVERVWSPTSVK